MNEASYTAWDEKQYVWPPPDGWYQASDGKWWPEGYGPPAEQQAAAAEPATEATSAAADATTDTTGDMAAAADPGGSGGFGIDAASAAGTATAAAGGAAGAAGAGMDAAESAVEDLASAGGSVVDGFEARTGGVVEGLGESVSEGVSDLTDRTAAVVEDVSMPDVGSVGDVSVPDVSLPDVGAPDVSVPDLGDVSAPDLGSVGDVSIPDVSAPDISVPDLGAPDISAPDLSAPDLSVPDLSVPDVSAPDLSIPDVSAPDLSVPDVSAPDLGETVSKLGDVSVPDVGDVPGLGDLSAPELRDAPGLGDLTTSESPTLADIDLPSTGLDSDGTPTRSLGLDSDVTQVVPGDLAGQISDPGQAGNFAPPQSFGQAPGFDAAGNPLGTDPGQAPGGFDVPGGQPDPGFAGQDQAMGAQGFPPPQHAPPPDGGQSQLGFGQGPALAQPYGDGEPVLDPNVDLGQKPKSGRTRKALLIILGVLLLLVIGALVFWYLDNRDSDNSEEAVNQTGPGSVGEPHQRATSVVVFYPDGDLDQRWIIEVLEPVVDVTGAREGSPGDAEDVFAATRVRVLNEGGVDGARLQDLTFNAVTAAGDLIEADDNQCPASADDLDNAATLQIGAEVEGAVCWSVPATELGGLLLGVQSDKVGGRVHISLQ